MLFFLCSSPNNKIQDGSPVDPLFEPPADPPLLTRPLKKYFYRHFGVSDFLHQFIIVAFFANFLNIFRPRPCANKGGLLNCRSSWNLWVYLTPGFVRILWLFLRTFGKNQEEPRRSVRFWAATGFSKQLFGSSREGIKLDWTYFIQLLFLSYSCLVCEFQLKQEHNEGQQSPQRSKWPLRGAFRDQFSIPWTSQSLSGLLPLVLVPLRPCLSMFPANLPFDNTLYNHDSPRMRL